MVVPTAGHALVLKITGIPERPNWVRVAVGVDAVTHQEGVTLRVALLTESMDAPAPHRWSETYLRLAWPDLAVATMKSDGGHHEVPVPDATMARRALPFLEVGACHACHPGPFLAYLFLQCFC